MIKNIVVIDDFLANVDQLIGASRRVDFPDNRGENNYPGRNSAQAVKVTELEDVVGRQVGERLRPSVRNAHGKFRLTLAGDVGLADIHIDACYWSGILYLTDHEDPDHGTQFFRHKATNSDRAPITPSEYASYGVKNDDEIISKILQPDGTNRDAWQHYMSVPMRKNRLVLLRPWMWHTAGPGFGQTVEDGRLIYLMFFDRA